MSSRPPAKCYGKPNGRGSPARAVAGLLARHGIEAILIGSATTALQGAPVTTVDIDSLFRPTAGNLKKLKAVAAELGAVILKPY